MKIIILLIKDFICKLIRRLYWLYRLMQAQKGSKLQIKFPVRVEGLGKLVFGNNCSIDKNTNFACGAGSKISFGNNCRIDSGVEIIAGKNARISFGNNCWIMKNTIIRTSNKFEFADDVAIATNCAVFSREANYDGILIVGKGTHIGDNTIIDVSDDITIKDEVAIGPNCTIYAHDHNYTHKEKAAWKGGVEPNPVIINRGAWVGANVSLLPGIVIGEKAVVAINAVVIKNIEPNTIYGGIPAKKIKDI